MRDYKMIALAYNVASESKGTNTLDKLIDAENGFLQAGDRFIWSRKTKLLDDLKKCTISNPETDNCVFVTRLKYDINKTEEYDQLLGRVYNAIKSTDIAVIVLLECQQHKNHFTLQDFQCEYGTDGGLEMFFDLIVAEEENEVEIKTHILKNKCGGLYAL